MNKLLRALQSMKLAVLLIGWLAAGSALATFVPQGREASFYADAYGALPGALIVRSGLSRFFSSLLFLPPAFLFFSNLSACAAGRFVRQLRRKEGRRHGPDILHLGLIVLILGAVVSFAGRKEGFLELAVGDSARLPDGGTLRLMGFDPKEWISTVDVERGGAKEVEGFEIRVNRPLHRKGLKIYMMSHRSDRGTELSGLQAVSDPGYPVILAAMGLVLIGLSLTFAQKIGEKAE